MVRKSLESGSYSTQQKVAAAAFALASLGVAGCAANNLSTSSAPNMSNGNIVSNESTDSSDHAREFPANSSYEATVSNPAQAYEYLNNTISSFSPQEHSLAVDLDENSDTPPRQISYYDLGEIDFETFIDVTNAFADANGYYEKNNSHNGKIFTFRLSALDDDHASVFSGVITANNPAEALTNDIYIPYVLTDSMLKSEHGMTYNNLSNSQKSNLPLLLLGLAEFEHESLSTAAFGARGIITPILPIEDLSFDGLEQLQSRTQNLQSA